MHNSRAFSIHATAKNAKAAASIANEVAAAFQCTISSIQHQLELVLILAMPEPRAVAAGLKPLVLIELGAIIGFLVGLAWIVLREIKQATICTMQTQLCVAMPPVLGVISTCCLSTALCKL